MAQEIRAGTAIQASSVRIQVTIEKHDMEKGYKNQKMEKRLYRLMRV